MPTSLSLTFRASPLPAGVSFTPQEFLDAIVARLSAEQPSSIGFFVTGPTAPTSNVGPWLKNGVQWWTWDDNTGAYVPEPLDDISVRYIASQSEPSPAVFTFWIELNGAGKAIAIKYYSSGAWKDVYEDKFALYPVTTAVETMIADASKRYSASANLAGAQTIPIDTVLHKVLFDSAFINQESAYDGANSRYVVPVNGIYRVTSNLQVDNDGGTSASMEIGIRITLDGASGPTTPTSGTSVATPPGDRWYPQVDGLIAAAAGSFLEVYIVADDGVNTDNVTIAPQSQFFIELVEAT